MPTQLDKIVSHKRLEVLAKEESFPLERLCQVVQPLSSPLFENSLREPNPKARFILEVKPASPSAGVIAQDFKLQPILKAYNQYASAISVLTDPKFFQGSLELLQEVAAQTPHPVLCKDFILEAYQIYEARLARAHAVLLIVKILNQTQLAALTQLIRELGMTPVIEIQTQSELNRALEVNPTVLLINNRNLEDFQISFETTAQLAPEIPDHILKISASGIENRDDVETLMPYCQHFLIGSALMKLTDDALIQKLQELTGP